MRNTHFEQFITDSFRDGIAIRELRLSHEEVEYIKSSYPKASITPCVQQGSDDGRHWYEISLYGLKFNEDKHFESMDDVTLHAEKARLLQELEQTKKELERVMQELAMVKSSIK